MARELSFGEKAVNLGFNPSADPFVQTIKEKTADLIDLLHVLRTESADLEANRMYAIAITDLETAQMWAVKGATWGK